MNADVEQLWTTALRRGGNQFGPARPLPAVVAVLVTLDEGPPAYSGEIARATGSDQGNTCRRLRRLEHYRLITAVDEVRGQGHQGGGRPAVIWALTGRGRALVAALRAENSERVA